MKFLTLSILLLCLLVSVHCQEEDEDDKRDKDESWWSKFKQRVKTVLTKWREDLKLLWDDVLAKAEDMRGWTADMFDSLKKKLKDWIETRPELPDDEKNEIENFINKLKVPTEKPTPKPKIIDP